MWMKLLMAESMGELNKKVLRWEEYTETKINISKIKVMVSGKNCGDVEMTEK